MSIFLTILAVFLATIIGMPNPLVKATNLVLTVITIILVIVIFQVAYLQVLAERWGLILGQQHEDTTPGEKRSPPNHAVLRLRHRRKCEQFVLFPCVDRSRIFWDFNTVLRQAVVGSYYFRAWMTMRRAEVQHTRSRAPIQSMVVLLPQVLALLNNARPGFYVPRPIATKINLQTPSLFPQATDNCHMMSLVVSKMVCSDLSA
ncbi:uncharacterized protein K460DRAFT_366314 [Cucurbitaria berberidis CBS 394.84]|uniref:Uncharacterized protein n=1 Tax=Cucurbitaria berberidis CBS 394.84 TaxID=1168544 RepID=A0A9P4GGY5_9PLEO|nr:uncharacterized protein K460DRAFT_366314 [Cucurbitaria berberidis CBS 394.84]KAF1845432.1 hypothetical protein K460DRAFT_366314 [Cucurbitaria berberidis CBS 394.84]